MHLTGLTSMVQVSHSKLWVAVHGNQRRRPKPTYLEKKRTQIMLYSPMSSLPWMLETPMKREMKKNPKNPYHWSLLRPQVKKGRVARRKRERRGRMEKGNRKHRSRRPASTMYHWRVTVSSTTKMDWLQITLWLLTRLLRNGWSSEIIYKVCSERWHTAS